ncbi:MAG: GGDEF domain-containing protein [Sulfuricurvum sp.]|uniref:GGDEF domain-containing protein n=1 Tax=Sulfuricurvum sp. TaxID=2025608 RepID=UPI00261177A9|nr:GGDEF domain-containing protein [Sulfuricurvum sp.]MDD2828066.1 GGDEF domain-containing protein [Sulfuricurvum sp.]
MLKGSIYRFLTANFESIEMTMMRSLMMINSFLLIGVLAFSTFAYTNLVVFHSYFIGILDTAAAIISLGALIDLQVNKKLNRTVYIGTANFFFFFLTFSYTNQNSDFGLIWTIFFPIFVITLMGHKKGLALTSFFYLILFSMAFNHIGIWDEGRWNIRSFLRFSIASIVLTYVVYVYEMAIAKANDTLAEVRKKEAIYLTELERLSSTDPLTGLYNRRQMDEILENHFEESKRYSTPFTLIMFDIDNFKLINDTYGHNIGDEVLTTIAAITYTILRKTDHFARWGGEEFLILASMTTSIDALILAEKIREKIQDTTFPLNITVTCSFGVTLCNPSLDIYTLIDQADTALYRAKAEGKNRVCIYTQDDVNA